MKRRKPIPVLAIALAAALMLSGCGRWRTPKLSDQAKDAIKDAVQDAVEDVKNAVEDAAESARSGESLTERSYEITECIDSLDHEWVSGKVDVYAAEGAADELDIGSVSGSVSVSGAFREAKTESVSDGVSLLLTSAPAEVRMNSVSGAQSLALPEDCGFTLEFDSVSGTLDSALALTSQGGTYHFGDGACRIEVETVSGGCSLRVNVNP